MDPYRPLDDDARALTATLLDADHGALATMLDGTPFVSRAACLWIDGTGLTLLISDLSEHTRALQSDPHCSVLLGQAGSKGDPLTHPRLTLSGRASQIDKAAYAEHWRKARPKTTLYFGFGDFRLWNITPTLGVLNGGFGKAYRLSDADITSVRHTAL